jgi:acyl carrier protein
MLDWKTQTIDRIANKSREPRVVITPETLFDDLGIESLDLIELIFELEEQFDIELPYNANSSARQTLEFATVGDLIALVAGQIDQPSTAHDQPAIQTEPLELP